MYRDARLLGHRERGKFVDRLAAGICPAMADGRTGDGVVLLAEGDIGGLAADLGGPGDEDAPPVPAGHLEHRFRAAHVGLDGVEGLAHDQLHPHRGRQVEDHVALRRQPVEDAFVEHCVDRVRKAFVIEQVLHVRQAAGTEIVDDLHPPALFQQDLREVAAHKAGAAGNQCPHVDPRLRC